MFFHSQATAHPSNHQTITSKIFTKQLIESHPATFRFIFWQKQLGLISDNPSTWAATWNAFYETYTSLINLNQLNDFIVDSSSTLNDQVLFHKIHIDVIRLSRYFKTFSDDDEQCQKHFLRLERILYLFAEYNSADGYNQGYHEILVILYYVAINGGLELDLDLEHCEAVAYFLLHALINGTIIGDIFIADQTSSALFDLCEQATKVLTTYDPSLADTFAQTNIEFPLFAISWIKILFALLYPINFVLSLWDLLFAQIDNLASNITFMIVSHIESIRSRLIGRDFVRIMIELNHLEVQTDDQFINIIHHFSLVQRFCGM
jgi:hypothetical protein